MTWQGEDFDRTFSQVEGEKFAVCDRYEKAIAIPMRALKSVGAYIGSETHQHKALEATFPLTLLTKSMPYSL
jgi:hypothetical protein